MNLKEFFGYSKDRLKVFLALVFVVVFLVFVMNSLHVVPDGNANPNFFWQLILSFFLLAFFVTSNLAYQFSIQLIVVDLILNLIYLWIFACVIDFISKQKETKQKILVVGGFFVIVFLFMFIVYNTSANPWPVQQYSSSPNENAINFLQELKNNQEVQLTGTPFSFVKAGSVATSVLAEENNLNREQVCLSIENELLQQNFTLKENSLITYYEEQSVTVKFLGLCQSKEKFLDPANNSLNELKNKGFNFEESGCSERCPDRKECCVLFLTKEE